MKVPEFTFGHLGLYVTDLEKMVEFYTRVLGFTVSDRGPIRDFELVFLSRNPDEHHQIALATGRPRDATFTTINQISLRLAGLEDLKSVHKELRAEGVGDLRIVSHGNAWSIYFPDPEGNRIEFYVPTPWYTPQPYAEPLDLTPSVDEIMRATEAECRNRPGFKTREEWSSDLARRLKTTAN